MEGSHAGVHREEMKHDNNAVVAGGGRNVAVVVAAAAAAEAAEVRTRVADATAETLGAAVADSGVDADADVVEYSMLLPPIWNRERFRAMR